MPVEHIARSPEESARGRTRPQRTDRGVFGVAVVLTLAFVLWGFAAPDSMQDGTAGMLAGTMRYAGWAFTVAASGFAVFVLWLACSRYGGITLGVQGEQPEFRTVTWIAMMCSTGVGTGLMFFGATEPLAHFVGPPPGTGGPGAPAAERAETAMATSFLHWTLYPWAMFSVVGLATAYSCFRRGRRQTISGVFTPLVGARHVDGAFGRVIDILAVVAVLFGAAASLGLGTLQIRGAVLELGWLPDVSAPLLVLTLTAVVVAYVSSGVRRGIQRLSHVNMVLATLLVVYVLVAGPTSAILGPLPASLASFFRELPQMATRTGLAAGPGVTEWLSAWTLFYWAWWISWAPMIGMFIARISRGRTVRQFLGGVVLVPSAVVCVWFSVFGGTALHLERSGAGVSEEMTSEGQLFAVLREFPIAGTTSLLVLMLMAVLFVSGGHAASTVMGTLSQRGTAEPHRNIVAVWSVLIGVVSAVVLLIGGGGADALTALQNLSIEASLPFMLVMAGMCAALVRDLRSDSSIRQRHDE